MESANRQRYDRIPKQHITTLQRWLDESEAESIVQWTHKFLAHAADGHRRGQADLATVQPTSNKISQVSRVFARVSEALLAYLLYHPDQDTHASDPSNIGTCRRVLTIMLAEEY